MEKREFKKLRISLTKLCNLACNYCVPPSNITKQPTNYEIINTSNTPPDNSLKKLSLSELSTAIESLHNILNINQVRLTGGEPLFHPQLTD